MNQSAKHHLNYHSITVTIPEPVCVQGPTVITDQIRMYSLVQGHSCRFSMFHVFQRAFYNGTLKYLKYLI